MYGSELSAVSSTQLSPPQSALLSLHTNTGLGSKEAPKLYPIYAKAVNTTWKHATLTQFHGMH